MKKADNEYDRIVQLINSATTDLSAWPGMLDAFCQYIGASSSIYWDWNTRFGIVDSEPVRNDASAVEQYIDHYHKTDFWMRSYTGERQPDIVRGNELVDDRTFLNSEFFNDFLVPQDIRDICCATLSDTGTAKTWIATFRPLGSEPFDQRYIQRMHRLLPSLKGAAQFRRARISQQGLVDSMLDTYEALPHALYLLSSKGTVLYANRKAHQLLRRGIAFSCERGLLVTRDSSVERALQAAMHGTDSTRTMELRVPGTGASSGHSLRVSIARIGDAAIDEALFFFRRRPTVMVLVDRPDSEDDTRSLLRQDFHFTRAEVDVCFEILKGLSIREIADLRNTSINTVRTQLKRAMSKAGVRSQSKLCAFLNDLKPL